MNLSEYIRQSSHDIIGIIDKSKSKWISSNIFLWVINFKPVKVTIEILPNKINHHITRIHIYNEGISISSRNIKPTYNLINWCNSEEELFQESLVVDIQNIDLESMIACRELYENIVSKNG